MQTVRSVSLVPGGPGSVSTGTQASPGKSGPASTVARAPFESPLKADKSAGSFGAGLSSPPEHQTLTPGAGSRSSSEPRAPTDGVRSRTSASRRKAVAEKVKVAGTWMHAAEFQKPAASRHTAKPTGTSKKKKKKEKGGGDTGMEVEASQTSLPSSLA